MVTRVRPAEGAHDNDGGAPAAASAGEPAAGTLTEHRNEVIVSGRLSAPALAKELPSGDQIVTWRLIVDRTVAEGVRKVDLVDCTTFGARLRRQAVRWREGDVIEVTGSLRRRFWRGAGGLQSRCEVEAGSARRVRAATGRGGNATELKRRRKP
jgi:single-strand DNA-binding protein